MKIFMEEVKEDPLKAKKSKKVECSWNIDEGKPQMESKAHFPKGEMVLRSEQPILYSRIWSVNGVDTVSYEEECCICGGVETCHSASAARLPRNDRQKRLGNSMPTSQ